MQKLENPFGAAWLAGLITCQLPHLALSCRHLSSTIVMVQ
jgi:hypothetical protein